MGRFKSDFNQSEGRSELILFSNVYRYTSAARKRILASNISINPRLIIQLGVNKLTFWLLISVDMKSAARSGFARESSRKKNGEILFSSASFRKEERDQRLGEREVHLFVGHSSTFLRAFYPNWTFKNGTGPFSSASRTKALLSGKTNGKCSLFLFLYLLRSLLLEPDAGRAFEDLTTYRPLPL